MAGAGYGSSQAKRTNEYVTARRDQRSDINNRGVPLLFYAGVGISDDDTRSARVGRAVVEYGVTPRLK